VFKQRLPKGSKSRNVVDKWLLSFGSFACDGNQFVIQAKEEIEGEREKERKE